MSAELPRVLVVAPVFNEAELIGEFLRRVVAVAPAAGIVGVLLVDDGSTDATCAVVREFGARPGITVPIRLVRLTRNFGHQNAMLAGLAVGLDWAEEENVPLLAFMDSDLQDKPEHLPELVAAVRDHDVAYAVRASRGEGWLFRSLARLFHVVLSRSADLPLPAHAGIFSVLRPAVGRAMLANCDALPYFPGLRAWVGYRQVGVALDRAGRAAGVSRVGMRRLVRLAVGALFAYSSLPIRLILGFSAVVIAISLVAALTITGLRLAGLVEVQGTALILISIYFSLGVQSLYLVVLAYMLRRTTAEASNRRPFLVLDDTVIRP